MSDFHKYIQSILEIDWYRLGNMFYFVFIGANPVVPIMGTAYGIYLFLLVSNYSKPEVHKQRQGYLENYLHVMDVFMNTSGSSYCRL